MTAPWPGQPRAGPDATEDGSGTTLVVGMIAAQLLVCLIALSLLTVTAVRHRAGVAADAAALAAASVVLGRVGGEACDIAARIAQANGAHLESCVDGRNDVRVEVTIPTVFGTAAARARAGETSAGVSRHD